MKYLHQTYATKCIVKSKGRFTLSDDSHGPQAVGLNYDRLREYVQRMGLKELWYLRQGDRPNASGRSLVPTIATGDWSAPDSWDTTSLTTSSSENK